MEPVQVPRVFSNRYELTHLIARGGMAQVYRARDRLLDRPVAIKVLFPELSVDRAFVERFRREAQAAANLSHPNIVPVFDWGEDGGTYFIVMEFIDGEPLSSVLRASGPLPADRVADIGAHVAAALAYAHRHGVVHRDVKPGNVLITDDGLVKVTDFGIARAVNTEESLTQTGAVMGTATYFSPEQAEGIGVDARSDIYSLGVVLFEMVAGRPPFLGESPVAVASKHVRDEPPRLRELAPTVPLDLEAVIAKAMAKSPDQRYASADELRNDLLRFAEGRPTSAAGVPITAAVAVGTTGVMNPVAPTRTVPVGGVPLAQDGEPPERESNRTAWLVAILVLLLVAVAVIAYLLATVLPQSNFAMPNVVGKPLAVATTTLTGKGLVVAPAVTRADPQVAKGTVLSTTPPAGQTVKKGDRVTLTVSSGPATHKQMVTVPTVVGQSVGTAVANLGNTHLKYKLVQVASDKPAGHVIAQTPPHPRSVPEGSTVKLTVPKSTATVAVPNVIGMSTAQAKTTLGGQGFTIGAITPKCSDSFGRGLVIATSPATNAQVPKGSAVGLTVSSGPCHASVPAVTGDTLTTAKSTLTQQGFTNVTSSTTPTCKHSQDGMVVKSTPSPGTTVATSSPVHLYVCNAPQASPPGKPGTPTATAGPMSAKVSWTAPATTGGGVNKYTVTSTPTGRSCQTTGALTCTVTGLKPGTAYSFTVRARNANGTSTPSTPSTKVTPTP